MRSVDLKGFKDCGEENLPRVDQAKGKSERRLDRNLFISTAFPVLLLLGWWILRREVERFAEEPKAPKLRSSLPAWVVKAVASGYENSRLPMPSTVQDRKGHRTPSALGLPVKCLTGF